MVRDKVKKLREGITRLLMPWKLIKPDPEAIRDSANNRPLTMGRNFASRHQKMVEWCVQFNKRNGNIVPDKSPESIYRKAQRAR